MRIIDNKRVNITDAEWEMYQKIVKSYTTATNKGEDLFQDLFESDNNGLIIFLKPPSKRQTSFEIFLFLMSIMQNQHLRCMYDQVADMAKQLKDKIAEVDEKLKKTS